MTPIPIVMASDKNYLLPTAVAISSILAAKNPGTSYLFFLMLPDKLDDTNQARYNAIFEKYTDAAIKYILMDNLFADISLQISHTTAPTYYRLKIAEILSDYDKCLYLDGDILVCNDLTELYNFDLGNNYVAGVKAPLYHVLPGKGKDYCLETGLQTIDQYINAGVLLLNLKEIRINGLCSRFMALTSEKLPSQDQDIINIVCYNHIAFLPLKFNAFAARIFQKHIVEKVFAKKEIHEAINSPVIIHYLDKIKPWNDMEGPFFYLWWKMALNSVCAQDAWSMAVNASVDKKQLNKLKNELLLLNNSKIYRIMQIIFNAPKKMKKLLSLIKSRGFNFAVRYALKRINNKSGGSNKNPLLLAKANKETEKGKNYYRNMLLPAYKYPEEVGLCYQSEKEEVLNLAVPKTFDEKIQWMKLYDRDARKSNLSDKYLCREFIAEKIGEKYLIPLVGIWNNFDEIDFSVLPEQFVLKATHGNKWSRIVKDKETLNMAELKEVLNNWLGLNYAFYAKFEAQYNDISPRIIAEKYIESFHDNIFNYKVFCFNGKAKYIMFMAQERNDIKAVFFDKNWNLQPFIYNYSKYEKKVKKPGQLGELLDLSEKLGEGFSYVCINFRILNGGEIKFVELSFSPESGFMSWNPCQYDQVMGGLITLPFEVKEYKENHPKISVIVPVYNTEKYIKKCLDSIINQTVKNLEIIVVNDGSADNSAKLCEDAAKKDKRIKIINKENEGVSSARNVGVENATGEYIGFVDSDDWIEPLMYEYLLNNAVNNNAEISIIGYFLDHVLTAKSFPFEDEMFLKIYNRVEAMEKLAEDHHIKNYPWNKLYRRSLFNNIRYPEGVNYEDIFTTYRLFDKVNFVAYHNKHLYHYIQRDDSITYKYNLKDRISMCHNYQERFYSLSSKYPELSDLLLKGYADIAIDRLIKAIEINPVEIVIQHDEEIQTTIIVFIKKYFEKIFNFTPEDKKNGFSRFFVKGAKKFKQDR